MLSGGLVSIGCFYFDCEFILSGSILSITYEYCQPKFLLVKMVLFVPHFHFLLFLKMGKMDSLLFSLLKKIYILCSFCHSHIFYSFIFLIHDNSLVPEKKYFLWIIDFFPLPFFFLLSFISSLTHNFIFIFMLRYKRWIIKIIKQSNNFNFFDINIFLY